MILCFDVLRTLCLVVVENRRELVIVIIMYHRHEATDSIRVLDS
jgi:hypothetical protein